MIWAHNIHYWNNENSKISTEWNYCSPKCHFYYGQLMISFRSKKDSLRPIFDRTVNLFHALVM